MSKNGIFWTWTKKWSKMTIFPIFFWKNGHFCRLSSRTPPSGTIVFGGTTLVRFFSEWGPKISCLNLVCFSSLTFLRRALRNTQVLSIHFHTTFSSIFTRFLTEKLRFWTSIWPQKITHFLMCTRPNFVRKKVLVTHLKKCARFLVKNPCNALFDRPWKFDKKSTIFSSKNWGVLLPVWSNFHFCGNPVVPNFQFVTSGEHQFWRKGLLQN